MPVVIASGAAFAAVFAGLSVQLREGHDPSLGNSAEKAKTQPRRVIVRRVIQRRVVVRVIPAPQSCGAPASAGGASAAPVTQSAPVVSAPAPAAAPAPAPAPVTRSS